MILMNSKADVRELLPSVQCPTLVLHRTGDRDSRVDEGRHIAERIPRARFVELEGDDHLPAIDPDQILDEVEEFLTGSRPARPSHRVLTTVLVTDLVGSTEHVQRLGDAAGRSSSTSTTASSARSSSASPARSSTQPVTASSPRSTGPRGRSGARSGSARRCVRSGSI